MKTAIELGYITANDVISEMGGTGRVASILKIKPPSVSEWRINNAIPDDKLIRLAPQVEIETNSRITRKFLFPFDWKEIWPELAQQAQTNSEKAA